MVWLDYVEVLLDVKFWHRMIIQGQVCGYNNRLVYTLTETNWVFYWNKCYAKAIIIIVNMNIKVTDNITLPVFRTKFDKNSENSIKYSE